MIGANAYIGKLIGGYRIVTEISSSPFSCVYRGEQPFHRERTVAIKLWHTIHLSSQKQLHLLQEAHLLKMLRHPHLLPILEIGIHEDTPYLVTEYAPKGSLRDRIKRQSARSVPIQETLTILSQVGQALQYIHQLNITHGNLKPENILFTPKGEALLTDFTISTLLDAASSAYTHNINSARYMAPEQFQGMTSVASDQFALGCIAYELLTGRVPFTAVDFSGLRLKHATETPLALTQLNLLLPLHIEEAILKALAKQRAARHASVKDFITALGTGSLPHAVLPAISSLQSPAQLTSTVGTSQEIKRQQANENNISGDPECSKTPPVIPQQIDMPLPVTLEPFEEEEKEENQQEDVSPLVASPTEVFEDGAESIQVHTNIVTEPVDVSQQDTAISPIIEVSQSQGVSREQVSLPIVVVVDSRAESVTGTYANANQAVSPAIRSRIGSSRRRGNQGSRYLWLAITVLAIVIAAILIGISSFALPLVLSPRTAAHMIPQTPSGVPSAVPSQVPSSMLSATPSPKPSLRPTPTAKPTPTPLPTPTPTSSPTPTQKLIVIPSQFSAETDCTWHEHWYTCLAILSLPQSYQGELAWSASSSGLDQVSFNPSAGVLAPGQKQQVTIHVHSNCPNTGSLFFSVGGSTVTVLWRC